MVILKANVFDEKAPDETPTIASLSTTRIGIRGMAGAVGNMVASAAIGYLLHFTGNNYSPLLTICAFAYLAALGIIHWLVPRLEPAKVEATASS